MNLSICTHTKTNGSIIHASIASCANIEMSSPNLLRQFRLTKNPFTDRTAEKTQLHPDATYMRSDLVDFVPNDTTYIFFGRRGSGKTTIRMMMQKTYQQYNAAPREGSRGHYLVDLCTPGHMTACLTDFQVIIIPFSHRCWTDATGRSALAHSWITGTRSSRKSGRVRMSWIAFCLTP